MHSEFNFSSTQNQMRMLLIENLIQDFKLKTEENNFAEILPLFKNNEEINAQMFREFEQNENEVI